MALLRDFLAPNVQRLKAKGDVDGLIKALAYEKDPNVRQRAARALGELRAQVALEPLGDSLKDPSPMVRRSAVYALGKIGGSQVVPLLGAVAQDRDVYNDAAVALSVIGDAAAAEALIPALGTRGDVGATAAAAMASMGPPALGPLIAALADESPEVREKAAGVLGQLGDQRAVAPLKLALRDGLVGEPAREALKKLGSIPVAVRPRSAAKKGMDQAGVAAQPPPIEPAVGKTASWMQQRVTSVPEETAPAEAREPQQEEPAGDALSLAVEETLAWLDRRDRPLEKAEEPAPEAEEPQKDESAGKDPSLHVVETQVWLQHVAGTPRKPVTPSAAVSESIKVYDEGRQVVGVWLPDAVDVEVKLRVILPVLGVESPSSFQVVPNTADYRRGFLVMFGLARAPGETDVGYQERMAASRAFNQGVVAARRSDFRQALACIDQVLVSLPYSPEAWNNKAFALANLNRNQEAIDCCDKAIELKPGYADPWDIKGRCLGRLGRMHEALPVIERYIELAPPDQADRVQQARRAANSLRARLGP